MEPRRDDGDDLLVEAVQRHLNSPQWSPVVTTGTTGEGAHAVRRAPSRRNGAPS